MVVVITDDERPGPPGGVSASEPVWLARLDYAGGALCAVDPGRRRRSVAGELEAALRRVGHADAVADPLVRTDAGVHARGQVAALRGLRPIAGADLLRQLRRQLPSDIAATGIAPGPARPEVVRKQYRYVVDVGSTSSPFAEPFAWRAPPGVELARLRDAAAGLAGERDWAAFRRRGELRDGLVRAVDEVSWRFIDGFAVCEVVGVAFTYRLVRSLVGAMVAVARGAATPEALRAALAGDAVDVAREVAPARGLHLVRLWLADEPRWIGEEGALVFPWER
jgi:tRNA pseudouridine38-40 synthase